MMRTIVGLGFLGCVAVALAGGVTASSMHDSDDDGEFGPWSIPVNLGPIVNSSLNDAAPAISTDGLSLYFQSVRDGQTTGPDLYVSRRLAFDLPWETPLALPMLNSTTPEVGPDLSRNGRYIFFASLRSGNFDLYASHRRNVHDDFAWGPPTALPAPVNGPSFDVGSEYVEHGDSQPQLYFSSDRSSGSGPSGLDIYATELRKDGTWSVPEPVLELNSAAEDSRPAIRSDGREMIFGSARDGNLDLYVTRRRQRWEAWSMPQSLGTVVNTPSSDIQPALSGDGRTLYFASNRPGGAGGFDLYACTRARLRERN